MKRRTASSREDGIISFIKNRWYGVVFIFVLSGVLGWLAWHIKACNEYQTTQLTATRKAWKDYQTATEKYYDNLPVLSARTTGYIQERDGDNDKAALKQNLNAMYEISKTLYADCNAAKDAQYQFSLEFKELGRWFAFDADSDPDLSQLCQGLARISEGLRFADTEQNGLDIKKLEKNIENLKVLWSSKKRERELRFKELEGEGFFRRTAHCF